MSARSWIHRNLALASAGAMAAALLGAPAMARAADTSREVPRSYAALMKMKPMAVMHMMDSGKKGFVTQEEFMAFHQAMFDKMDGDRDGKLSQAEWIEKVHTAP